MKAEIATIRVTAKKGIVRFESSDGKHTSTLVLGESRRGNGERGDKAELWLVGGVQYGTLRDYTLLELLYRAANGDDFPEHAAE